MNLRVSGWFTESSSEALSLTCDYLGIMRSALSIDLIATAQIGGVAYNVFGAIGALFILTNASRLVDKAIAKLENAKTTEMKIFHGFVHIPGNVSYLVVGLALLALKVNQVAKIALSWTPIFSAVLMSGFLARSAFKLIEACYGLSLTYTLASILKEESHPENIVAKLKELLREDREKLEKQTSIECVKEIEGFLEGWGDATSLLEKVKKANYNANSDYWLLFGVSAVSTVAAGAGLAFSGPAVDIIRNFLMIVGNLIWVNIDSTELRNKIKERFWLHHERSESGKYSKQEQAEFWGKTALGIITAPVWIVPTLAHHHWKNVSSLAIAS